MLDLKIRGSDGHPNLSIPLSTSLMTTPREIAMLSSPFTAVLPDSFPHFNPSSPPSDHCQSLSRVSTSRPTHRLHSPPPHTSLHISHRPFVPILRSPPESSSRYQCQYLACYSCPMGRDRRRNGKEAREQAGGHQQVKNWYVPVSFRNCMANYDVIVPANLRTHPFLYSCYPHQRTMPCRVPSPCGITATTSWSNESIAQSRLSLPSPEVIAVVYY
jgi:hypothetical protein